MARVELERASGGIGLRQDLRGRISLEAGEGAGAYFRAAADLRFQHRLGPGEVASWLHLGSGTNNLPAYRSFAIGGRGTLVGEPFRAYGGREMALAHVEWRFDVGVPALSLGSFASTGRSVTLAPFLSAGYAARPLPQLPWTGTDGIRPVAGLAVEWLMRLIRIEAGFGLRGGRVGVTVDINRDWWGLL
jgi:outer membrane protein assembly factor BamA